MTVTERALAERRSAGPAEPSLPAAASGPDDVRGRGRHPRRPARGRRAPAAVPPAVRRRGAGALAGRHRALEWLRGRNTSSLLVLVDLNMPAMDGIIFMRRLADQGYSGAVAIVSSADERVLETAAKLGGGAATRDARPLPQAADRSPPRGAARAVARRRDPRPAQARPALHGERGAARGRQQRDGAALPAEGLHGRRQRGRPRGAGPMGPSGRRTGPAGPVRRCRRGARRHRHADRSGPVARARAGPSLEQGGDAAARGGQRVDGQPPPPRLPRTAGGRSGALQGPDRRPPAGGDGVSLDERPAGAGRRARTTAS